MFIKFDHHVGGVVAAADHQPFELVLGEPVADAEVARVAKLAEVDSRMPGFGARQGGIDGRDARLAEVDQFVLVDQVVEPGVAVRDGETGHPLSPRFGRGALDDRIQTAAIPAAGDDSDPFHGPSPRRCPSRIGGL